MPAENGIDSKAGGNHIRPQDSQDPRARRILYLNDDDGEDDDDWSDAERHFSATNVATSRMWKQWSSDWQSKLG